MCRTWNQETLHTVILNRMTAVSEMPPVFVPVLSETPLGLLPGTDLTALLRRIMPDTPQKPVPVAAFQSSV